MNKWIPLLWLFVLALSVSAQTNKQYDYVTYHHDVMHTRIYTLENGLKVFLTVYKDAPRIQCLVPVRVGSKHDPAETTGLAHYLEHLMFKGTPAFGTTNWEAEKPLLEQIEQLFEIYRHTADPQERATLYRQIDSISYIASGYAVPNEYDKMMKFIGSQGTNAATSNDYTVYIEDIPSNQLENWAAIQYERFARPVFRLFHTELETVYEEKNNSLANDNRKASEAMLHALFPHNAYGQQTTLGSVEHLKNPSLTNISNFFNAYYAPNNMAVCLSGDFDFDEAIAIVDRYFGQLVAHPIPHYVVPEEDPIESVIERSVYGHEAEFVNVAFRMDLPANHPDVYIMRMLDYILSNGQCGLMDQNLSRPHLVNRASSYPYVLCDNSAFVLSGRPNEGQTLEEVRDLLLQQLALVKSGSFDESLMEAALNNIKVSKMRQLENNRARANALASAFEYNVDWFYASNELAYYEKITKQDVVEFANKHFPDNAYVVIYKRKGQPAPLPNVTKPPITAIQLNRDAESDFFAKLKTRTVRPIEPLFVDFQEAITFGQYKKQVPIYHVNNEEDDIFTLRLIYPAGEMHDLLLGYVSRYMQELGTAKKSVDQIKTQFYTMACRYNISVSDVESSITLSGLDENLVPAFQLMMDVVSHAQADTMAMRHYIADLLKQRKDAKSSQSSVLNCLRSYGEFGPDLVAYQLTDEQVKSLNGDTLLAHLRKLLTYQLEVAYYGPSSINNVQKLLSKYYKLPKHFATPPTPRVFERQPTDADVVFYAPYPAKQSRIVTTMRSDKLDASLIPMVRMYNQYFGGSMNAIVFQEMREKRSLAYTAQSSFVLPEKVTGHMYNYSYVATQNDKILDAMTAFDELFDDMPLSEPALSLAKESAKQNIAAARITKMSIINTYLNNRKMGIAHDYRRDVYDSIDGFTMEDVRQFNQKYIKGKAKTYMILATESEVDLKTVEEKFGPVRVLTLEDIFGY